MGFFGKVKEKTKNESKKMLGSDLFHFSDFIKYMLSSLTPKKIDFKIPDRIPSQDFLDLMARMNLSEENLSEIYKMRVIGIYIYLLAFIFGIIYLFYFLLTANIFGAIPLVGFLVFCVAGAFSCSFIAMQIYFRKVLTFKVWYKNKKYWIPKTFVLKKRKL